MDRKKDSDIILVGGGGHTLSLIECADLPFIGYLAPKSSSLISLPWLGDDSMAEKFTDNLFHIAFIYSGLPLMDDRLDIIDRYEKLGVRFATIIADSAIITPNSEIGEGAAVLTGAIINRAKIGKHTIINSGAIVEHDCNVGDNTFIGPGAIVGGFTNIGSNCFIGLGAKIKNGITIADNVTVAMGEIVNHDLLTPGIYHGNPLRCYPIEK